MVVPAGARVKLDCAYQQLNLYSETDASPFTAEPGSVLWLQRCYVNNAESNPPVAAGPQPGGWCDRGPQLFSAPSPSSSSNSGGAVIRLENSTVRWWSQVRATKRTAAPPLRGQVFALRSFHPGMPSLLLVMALMSGDAALPGARTGHCAASSRCRRSSAPLAGCAFSSCGSWIPADRRPRCLRCHCRPAAAPAPAPATRTGSHHQMCLHSATQATLCLGCAALAPLSHWRL